MMTACTEAIGETKPPSDVPTMAARAKKRPIGMAGNQVCHDIHHGDIVCHRR